MALIQMESLEEAVAALIVSTISTYYYTNTRINRVQMHNIVYKLLAFYELSRRLNH